MVGLVVTGRGQGGRRRNDPNRRESRALPMATCPECGKQSYVSKQVAKTAARQVYPGDQMRVYACSSGNGFWHLTSQTTGQTTRIREYLADHPPDQNPPASDLH